MLLSCQTPFWLDIVNFMWAWLCGVDVLLGLKHVWRNIAFVLASNIAELGILL